jgi:C-terminal processing protease CtpA/Prc
MAEHRETVVLKRHAAAGLGFNIKGGSDAQVFPGDDGIYVALIKPDGAAAVDGRLQEGDQIVEVNGFGLAHVAHQTAVEKFISAGDEVTIVVIPGQERRIKAKASELLNKSTPKTGSNCPGGCHGSSGCRWLKYVVISVGIAAVALYVVHHRVKRT